MDVFQPTYNLFGHELTCKTIQVGSAFILERNVDHWVKNYFQPKGWSYNKIDTQRQHGFPDILLLRKSNYIMIEDKLLRKKQLLSLEDDLKWQFGQLAFAKRSLSRGNNYLLCVGKNKTIAFIGDELCLDNV